jgi:hypothetical protein
MTSSPEHHRPHHSPSLLPWLVGILWGWAACQVIAQETHDATVQPLPSLRIDGHPAVAHTQGIVHAGGHWWVTARREDVHPRRAVLLRWKPGDATWDSWDLTPIDATGNPTALDHAGGFHESRGRVWIPVAESRAHGKSVIRTYTLARFAPGGPAVPDAEFPVDDHIGAIAVAEGQKRLYGANWDTESVYVWDLDGHLERKITGAARMDRQLGILPEGHPGEGLAVQDWKWTDGHLVASGLASAPGGTRLRPAGRVVIFEDFLQPTFRRTAFAVPMRGALELAREAMTPEGTGFGFLPEDLGPTNRLFHIKALAPAKH